MVKLGDLKPGMWLRNCGVPKLGMVVAGKDGEIIPAIPGEVIVDASFRGAHRGQGQAPVREHWLLAGCEIA